MLQNYIDLLRQYQDAKVSLLFSSLPLPNYWQLHATANRIDTVNSNTDYLVDLYHYREIAKLFKLQEIELLETHFRHDLSQEEFILMLIRVLELPPDHLPYIVNGARQLYELICWKFQIAKVTIAAFLTIYFTQQQESKPDLDDMALAGSLKRFEEFKKDKYGFKTATLQDVAHHNSPIKRVFYCGEWIICLDEMSDHFRLYDAKSIRMVRKVSCTNRLHKSAIHLLDMFYADGPKVLGACCQDATISFWALSGRFQQEYSYTCQTLQVQIIYVETNRSWFTVDQENQLREWSFTNLIESSDGSIIFTNSSAATSTVLQYHNKQSKEHKRRSQKNIVLQKGEERIAKKISCIKEIVELKKLLICTYDKKIIVWSPTKHEVFVVIDIPSKHASAHTVAFSARLQMIFSVGFDQETMIWQLDEVNEDYNKIGSITISEAGSTVSTMEVFDEYGLLVSLDDLGIMRCWDIENWNIVYRFDLNCRIRNTISCITRLDQGRFLLTTSRLYVLEFPQRQPRKVKGRFKPIDHMVCANSRVYVASQSELIAFNWNNAYIEEKLPLPSPVLMFFVIHDTTVNITRNGILQISKLALEYQLFEDASIDGCEYHPIYEHLIAWNRKTLRIFQAQTQGKQLSFPRIRQATLQYDILKAINFVERDAIGVLFRTNQLLFLQYSTMNALSSISLEDDQMDEAVLDFFLIPDYDCLILQTQTQLLFYKHRNNFSQFQAVAYLPVNYHHVEILRLNFESVDRILETYWPLNFKYQNLQFFKQLEQTNQNKYADHKKDFSFLSQLQELRQKNIEMNKTEKRPSAIFKFKKAVTLLINLIRNNSVDLLYSSPYLERPSQESEGNLAPDLGILRRNAQLISSIQALDIEAPQPDYSIYSYHQAYIWEDFYSQYFVVLKTNSIRLANLQPVLKLFDRVTAPYLNKHDSSKIYVSVSVDEDKNLELKPIPKARLNFTEIQHNSIFPKVINFYDKTLLLTFGKEDNALKLWDITFLRNEHQLLVYKEYLDQKYNQVTAQLKLQDLIDNQSNQVDIELQKDLYKQRSTQVLSFIHTEEKLQFTEEGAYLQGEYILPLEQKVRWNLKEFNSSYRISQMKVTFSLMKQMLLNWQEANKYQLHQLKIQIDNKIMLQNRLKYQQVDSVNEPDVSKKSLYFTQLGTKFALDDVTESLIRSRNQTKAKSTKLDRAPHRMDTTLPRLQTSKSKEKDKDREKEKTSKTPPRSPPSEVKKIDNILNSAKKCFVRDKKTKEVKQVDVHSLNSKLNQLYFPTQEQSWRVLQTENEEKERNKNRRLLETSIGKNDSTGLNLIKFNHRATSREKLQFLMNYNFDETYKKQSQSIKDIIQKYKGQRSLTPLREYLKPNPKIRQKASSKQGDPGGKSARALESEE